MSSSCTTLLLSLLRRLRSYRPALSAEGLALLTSVFFSICCNGMFWRAMFGSRDWAAASTWVTAVCLFIAVTALHFLLLSLVVNRWTAKPVLTVLLLGTALAVYYMNQYTVYLDSSMMRNILETDLKEARELLSLGLLVTLALYASVPITLLWRVRLRLRGWPRNLVVRLGWNVGALVIALAAIMPVFQDLSSTMRNHKELRYLITPGNYLFSLGRVIIGDSRAASGPRQPVGLDAQVAMRPDGSKPLLLVIVVGETARAANWGLNGYARQTTPELAGLDVLNFSKVTACGSSTAVSLPCMFSAVGRRNYDERRIRNSESLLHALNHAGIETLWRDNQSGCKGVCDGLPSERLDKSADPVLCDGERCFDEILLQGLDAKIAGSSGDMVIVLHQLGNHGPAYYRRYPEAYHRFQPACTNPDLRKCSREEIVNAYDNALLYTDHFLAQTIALLAAQHSHDAAMLYISDHGESLGEQGVYLHGLPWLIAPSEQTEVPMVLWLSSGFAASRQIDTECLRARAAAPLNHDYLFHTVLGLLDVRTRAYEPGFDFTARCQKIR